MSRRQVSRFRARPMHIRSGWIHRSVSRRRFVLRAATTFALDLFLPLGVAGGVPYVALVLVGLWFPAPRAVLVLAGVASVLTVAGYFLSEPASVPWIETGIWDREP